MNHRDTPQAHNTSLVVPELRAAEYTGLSVAYLRKARAEGKGPAYVRFGRAVRYHVADLDKYIDEHRVETGSR